LIDHHHHHHHHNQLTLLQYGMGTAFTQLDRSSSPPPPPQPAHPPAVRHGHGIHSFRSFAMGTHMPLELAS